MPLKYYIFKNIIENRAFAIKVQMLHNIFKSIQNLT